MKTVLISLSLLLTISLSGFNKSFIKVSRNYSDARIEKIERKITEQYGVKVDVNVISRDSKNKITNLECIRYGQDGKQASSCSSDKFGLLLITPNGCKIADLGYEKQLKSL